MNEIAVDIASTLDRVMSEIAPIPHLLDTLRTSMVDVSILDAVTGLGMGSLAVSESDGGLGLGRDDLALVVWAGGRRLLPTLARLDATLVRPLVSGDRRWACGFPDFGSDASSPATVWTVPDATHALVVGETQAWVVELDRAELVPAPGVDAGQGRAKLTFSRSAAVEVVNSDYGGIVDRARIMAIAELSGIADRVTEVTVNYAAARSQFGQPLSSFQAIQHTLAEMRANAELIRSAVARLVGAAVSDSVLTASLAAGTATLARQVVEHAIQVHGGMGFTWEYGLHLYYRRSLAIQEQFGAPTALRRYVGQTIVARRTQ